MLERGLEELLTIPFALAVHKHIVFNVVDFYQGRELTIGTVYLGIR